MMNTRKLTHLAMFVVLQIVVSRFLAIPTPIVKISFTYVPMAIAGYLYGWLFGGVAAALADVLGAVLFPQGGAYFPGFTLSAFIIGAMYGLLKDADCRLSVIVGIALFNTIAINLLLNTYWLSLVLGKSYLAMIPVRVTKSLVMLPIKIFVIKKVLDYMKPYKTRLTKA
ncbi:MULTISPECIES: folate family ECF transporter S component [Erysipelothrix]|uniref:Folate family ECF transporter S component n=1 Tax=Erysipelothrix piscisicarius TaxID=2485784 RepID=A0A3S8RM06_9FIRM|nr:MULTISPECIES: folate family ECF transporter S component [Erysipelothrix]AZK43990.1 folate family ECF transporter S component [Erysipelothrix piscisicarius]MBK2402651.1 folate family ECF transporter S component [Erysipelothrix sp. strain 2 (EsS2-6-Brazil)]MBK2403701.1 folate family ECF transporter S component [Erysipelothrix sp. strain 2 (EsS2-7-Brazil)]NBA01439.1 folate family ECF transporter S component [Erysipelothrix rhusiopathiae]